MKMILCLLTTIILIPACEKNSGPFPASPLTDIDGNTFDAIEIGDQFWMQQNLKTAHYRNGDPIPEVTTSILWSSLTSGAWCWYNNDSVAYAAVYGKLYNWYAVNDPRGLAPEGWHIPSDEEWSSLSTAINGDATNPSGFSALLGGYRGLPFGFSDVGKSTGWWSSTEDSDLFAWNRDLGSTGNMARHHHQKYFGYSVRCVWN